MMVLGRCCRVECARYLSILRYSWAQARELLECAKRSLRPVFPAVWQQILQSWSVAECVH